MPDSTPTRLTAQETRILWSLATVATALAAIGGHYGPEYFARLLGGIPSWLALVLASAVAFTCMSTLARGAGLRVLRGHAAVKGVGAAAFVAIPFAIVMALADWAAPFRRDINVPGLLAWAFYPAMAWVAETAFHLLPLTLFLLARGRVGRLTAPSMPRAAWFGAALAEPLFQLWFPASDGRPIWADVHLVVQLFAFELVQLWLFRRFGFVSMLAGRLIYYALWHLLWGAWRLSILSFP